MKKIFIVMLLVIASGLWNSTNGACMVPAKSNSDLPTISVSGELYETAYPCEPGEMCPTCLTPALDTENGIYYLTTTDAEIEAQLDSLFNYLYSINCICTFPTRVTGTTYQNGSFKYINISHMETGDPQPVSQENKISSLCDEWHVLHEPFGSFLPYSTIHFALTTDTTINARHYIKLESTEGKNTLYEGALREENKKVYFVPVGSNNEYLLYAFDAQKGDQLSNIWGGGREEICKNSFNAVVTDISDDTPRIFTLTLNTPEEEYYQIQWLEGIGFMDGPIGTQNICDIADYGVFRLLCAYKEGVQVYTSKYGEEFGCEFNGIHTEDADTIPLYTGDDPGSSTIDPIDPNQVVVTLNGNELNIKESSGDEINYTLVLNKNKQAPAKEQTVQANSFIHSVSIELTESGYYTLQLTNPNWDSSLVGRFQYINSAIEEVQGDEKCNAKILRDGQLLIRVGERLYTPTGIQIQ